MELITHSLTVFNTLILLRYASILPYSISTVERIPFFSNFLYKIATLFLFLVVVSNLFLLNPGLERQEGLSCFFHNVQGFINLNSLAKQSPDLNITKVMEFQAFVFEKKPDIIILNETWLKPTINSNEIIPGKSYKVFRKDRSSFSHPLTQIILVNLN